MKNTHAQKIKVKGNYPLVLLLGGIVGAAWFSFSAIKAESQKTVTITPVQVTETKVNNGN